MSEQDPSLVSHVRNREAIKELKACYARGADAVFGNPGPASVTVLVAESISGFFIPPA